MMWMSGRDYLALELERERQALTYRRRKAEQTRPSMPPQPDREIFVTVGATAAFDDLIQRVASQEFQKTVKQLQFNRLTIQCGKSLQFYHDHKSEDIPGMKVKVFDFNAKGLGQEMRGTLAEKGRRKGVVISHAGAGSVLDAMRLGCSIIVVPNESLLDNHQAELADELEQQGYVTRGTVKDLSDALRRCDLQSSVYAWPPPSTGKGLFEIIDETIVKEDAVNGHLD